MADSLHCNNCLKTGFDGSVKYYLTECEKVFCNKCIENNIKNCVKCSPNVCKTIELNDRIKPEIQMLFRDVSSSFQRLQKVETFQKNQRNNLIQKLIQENKRLVNDLNQQKLIEENLRNEMKTIRTQMADNQRLNTSSFDNLFSDSNECQTNANKENHIFKDLFKMGSQRQDIYGSNAKQMKNNTIDDPMNEFMSPMVPMSSNRFKPSYGMNGSNLSGNPLMSGPKQTLSPLQSIRRSKISINPPINSRHLLSSSQQNKNPNNFQIPDTRTPITYIESKYKNSLSSLSSSSMPSQKTLTPTNMSRYPRRSPSNVSSIMSLSSLYRKSYLNK